MDPTTVAQTLAAYARPARPVTPTPATQDNIADALYGGGIPPAALPAPLPSWLPQNVQNYINQAPSYAEGQRQTQMPPSITRGGELYDQTPQIADIQRLFRNRITQNAPTGLGFSSQQLKNLMQMPGFSGFAGGEEI
jgi:hypothetical protein